MYVAALVDHALRADIGLADACRELHAADASATLAHMAHALFDAAVPTADTQDDGEERRGLDRLLDLVRDPDVVAVFGDVARTLWEQPSAAWEGFARDRARATVAAAVADACAALCPEFSTGEVIVDLESGIQSEESIEPDLIWVTERVIGGGGVVEELHRRCAENPRRFFTLLTRALEPGDFEVVDRELPRAISLVCEPGPVQLALRALREASTQRERQHSLEQALTALRGAGLDTRHAVVAAINARLVRPGATPATDVGFRRLVEAWRTAEARLGIDLEPRTFALHARDWPDADEALPASGDAGWRFGQIIGLLWPHGWRARAEALQTYNEFAAHPPSDRFILTAQTRNTARAIDLDGEWRLELEDALVTNGTATLAAGPGNLTALAQVLAEVGTYPIDTGALLLYPWIESIRHEDGGLRIGLAVEAPAT